MAANLCLGSFISRSRVVTSTFYLPLHWAGEKGGMSSQTLGGLVFMMPTVWSIGF